MTRVTFLKSLLSVLFRIKDVDRSAILSKMMDQIITLGWICGGLLISITSTTYGLYEDGSPGPGLMPFLVGVSISLCALIRFIKGQVSRKRSPYDLKIPGKNFIYTILGLVAYALLLEQIGFILVTIGFLAAILFFVGEQPWYLTILISISISIGSYFLFSTLLQVQLPYGIFGF
jgi:putative tricarboxylic transport membrane protein